MELTNCLWDEFSNKLLQITSRLPGHDFHHLLADLPDLTALGIACALHLLLPLLGEADAEQAQHIAICGLHINICLNEGLPLPYKTSQLVCCEVHALQ